MVLINMYRRMESILLSKKVGVGIRNLDEDWSKGIVDDFVNKST